MIIKRRGLNPNETYCCTIRDVKQVFGKADIQVYFGYNICRKEKDNRKYYQSNKNFNDMLILKMKVCKETFQPTISNWHYYSSIRFFILKKEAYNEVAYKKFIKEVLPKIYEKYEEHKYDNPFEKKGVYSVLVGYDGENFNFYEETAHRYLED